MTSEEGGYAASYRKKIITETNKPEPKNTDDAENLSKEEKEKQIRIETLRRRKAQIRKKKEMQMIEQQEMKRKLQERKLRTREIDPKWTAGNPSASNTSVNIESETKAHSPQIQRPMTGTRSLVYEPPPKSVSGHTMFSENLETMSYAESAALFKLEAMQIRDLCEELGTKDLHEFNLSPLGGIKVHGAIGHEPQPAPPTREFFDDRSMFENNIGEYEDDNRSVDSLDTETTPSGERASRREGPVHPSGVQHMQQPQSQRWTNNAHSRSSAFVSSHGSIPESGMIDFADKRQSASDTRGQAVSRMSPPKQMQPPREESVAVAAVSKPKTSVIVDADVCSVVTSQSNHHGDDKKARWGGGVETEIQKQRRLASERRKEYAEAVRVQQKLNAPKQPSKQHQETRNLIEDGNFQPAPYMGHQVAKPASTGPVPRCDPGANLEQNIKETGLGFTMQEKELLSQLTEINNALRDKSVDVQGLLAVSAHETSSKQQHPPPQISVQTPSFVVQTEPIVNNTAGYVMPQQPAPMMQPNAHRIMHQNIPNNTPMRIPQQNTTPVMQQQTQQPNHYVTAQQQIPNRVAMPGRPMPDPTFSNTGTHSTNFNSTRLPPASLPHLDPHARMANQLPPQKPIGVSQTNSFMHNDDSYNSHSAYMAQPPMKPTQLPKLNREMNGQPSFEDLLERERRTQAEASASAIMQQPPRTMPTSFENVSSMSNHDGGNSKLSSLKPRPPVSRVVSGSGLNDPGLFGNNDKVRVNRGRTNVSKPTDGMMQVHNAQYLFD